MCSFFVCCELVKLQFHKSSSYLDYTITMLLKWPMFVFLTLIKDALLIEACGKKWESFGNSCYLFVTPDGSKYGPVQSDWSTARSDCLKRRADLVSLTTQEEVDFVYSHTKNKAYRFWIGLTYETQVKNNTPWTWSNGDMLNITQWNKGEPNRLNEEHCTHILKRRKYWNNRRCDYKNAWICEKPKMIESTVKATGLSEFELQVKTTISTTTTSTTTEATTKRTDDNKSDMNPRIITLTLVLYIFLPMILLGLIIVIILLVRKHRAPSEKESSSQDNERETAENEETSQQNHNQVLTENDGYTELHHNREPENTYMSLNLYDKPDDNSNSPYVIAIS